MIILRTQHIFLSHGLLWKQHQSYLAWCCFVIQHAKTNMFVFDALKTTTPTWHMTCKLTGHCVYCLLKKANLQEAWWQSNLAYSYGICLMQDEEGQSKGAGVVEFQHCDEALQAISRLTNTVQLPL